MKNPVEKFPPGSEWLYLRIYGGPQALEEWMTGHLMNLLAKWQASGLVNQFHYVHYLDPDYHLRLRILLSDEINSGIILVDIRTSCQEQLCNDLFWKIEAGTYEPEYERYGSDRMSLVERWFEIDSYFWLQMIQGFANEEDPDIWKHVIKSTDLFLDDFGAGIEDKIRIVNDLRESAFAFFGLNSAMKVQLDNKYRKVSDQLYTLLGTRPVDGQDYLVRRTKDSAEIFKKILDTFGSPELLFASDILPNLIHMSLNRAFRTRHRQQEVVIYDFLSRYYESIRARTKAVNSRQ